MSFKKLLNSGPRNIRKKLFRDIIAILLITTCSIVALLSFIGISTKDKVSAELIRDASQQVQRRFISFLEPFDIQLRILSKAGQVFLEDIDDIKTLEKVFIPYLEINKDLSHVTIIRQNGDYSKIQKIGDRFESFNEKFNENSSLLISQPYRGAMTISGDSPVFWSESFTSNHEASGISASIKVQLTQMKQTVVVVFFIPGAKILSFISDIETSENMDIILYSATQVFLSSKQLYYLDNSADGTKWTEKSFPKTPEISKAFELWNKDGSPVESVQKFRSGSTTWWAGYTPLGEKRTNAWVSIIIPETDIGRNVYQQWSKLGTLVALITLFACGMTFNLVRRYSFQLKDLPQQNLFNSNLVASAQQLIAAGESSTLEFKSTMRMNLKTGKTGKEIEIAWLKGVVSFMNSDGGILLIGVNDDGVITGIEADEFANEDKCRLHFKNLINSHIGASFSRYIHLKIAEIGEKTILIIECERVRRPVFLTIGKTEDFYIRSGPSSIKLSMSQMVSYLSER